MYHLREILWSRVLRTALAAMLIAVLILVSWEGAYRKHVPGSAARPSNWLRKVAEAGRVWFRWIGWHLARFINIYEWIRDFVIDLAAVLEPMFKALLSPFYVIQGSLDYFMETYSDNVVLSIAYRP